jgi:hypothetical protein
MRLHERHRATCDRFAERCEASVSPSRLIDSFYSTGGATGMFLAKLRNGMTRSTPLGVMKLRSHLFFLTTATLLPMIALAFLGAIRRA